MQPQSPKVSIGMPVYNGAAFLAEALDSLLAQTFENFELIISDNASTDDTEAICRLYAAQDARIRYIRNETNLGAARNYNHLVELAQGQYFKWAAYDDTCAPEYLARCVRALDEDSGIVLSYPRTVLVKPDNDDEYYNDGFNLIAEQPHERFLAYFHAPALCNPVFGLIRTDALRRTALIGEYIASDRILLGELALLGKFHEVPEYLFLRRWHTKRSLKAYTTESDLTAWFNPEKGSATVFPRISRIVGTFTAIQRAPLSPYERLRCWLIAGRYLMVPRRWMLTDLGKALRLAKLSIQRTLERRRMGAS